MSSYLRNLSLRSALATIVVECMFGCVSSQPKRIEIPPNSSTQLALVVVPGLEEPLLRAWPTTPAEDKELAAAVTEFQTPMQRTGLKYEVLPAFRRFIEAHPRSGWNIALLTNIGLSAYRAGYFSRALVAWQTAWHEGRAVTEPAPKRLVDRAVAELARMHARLGHADELETLLEEIRNRPIDGSATESITGAREGWWKMRHEPEFAYRCGPKALANVLQALGASPAAIAIAADARSGVHGTTLEEIAQLAEKAGVPVRLVHREPGEAVPVPSVINWKVNHFAAIVAETGAGYHIQDPTFGYDQEMTRAAIDAEGSGYFLVPLGAAEDVAWREVTPEEATSVFGMGYTASNNPDAVSDDDVKIHGCKNEGHGMCVPDAHAMNVSININDTPIGYAPQKGPAVYIRFTYNQRDAAQPANFPYSNVGPKWTFNMVSYVEDYLGDGTTVPSAGFGVSRYKQGGGVVRYDPGRYQWITGAVGSFLPEKQTGAVLSRVPAENSPGSFATSYTVTNPDNSKLVYATSDGATTGYRRMFLTSIQDPYGNAVTLEYDTMMRLWRITDAAGRQTWLFYSAPRPGGDPRRLWYIRDPFGRESHVGYLEAAPSLLGTIGDVQGMWSNFTYSDGNTGYLDTLYTDYGMQWFYSEENGTYRMVELTDAAGGTERLEFNHESGVSSTESRTPTGMAVTNGYLQYRNSFYWDKYVMSTYNPFQAVSYSDAMQWHWLHASSDVTSPILESVKKPLQNRVWYTYYRTNGENRPNFEGITGYASQTGRVLDDTGLSQVTQTDPSLFPSVFTDAAGRKTRYNYYGHQFQLRGKFEFGALQNVQQQTASGTWTTVAAYGYGSEPNPTYHSPRTVTDAAGRTWQYDYNAAGQLRTATNPKNETVTYNYDLLGRLDTVVNNATNTTIRKLNYLPNCETTNPSHINCDLPQSETDSEQYTRSFSRDALDRITDVTFPDQTSEHTEYTALDVTKFRDRMNRETIYTYFPNRKLKTIKDPLNRLTQYDWYANGVLKSLTDANNHTTRWTLGENTDNSPPTRQVKKIYHDNRTVTYDYDQAGRLRSITDPLNQKKTVTYNADNSVASVTYTNAVNPTPNVSFVYDPFFPRMTSMNDGIGATSWTYAPIGTNGALSVQTEDGPFPSDTITRGYDELGRLGSRDIGGSTETWQYDNASRVEHHTTALGTFDYTYLGQTGSVRTRTLAGTSIATTWDYDTNLADRRLKKITHSNGGQTLDLGYDRFGAQSGANLYGQVTSVLQSGGNLGSQLFCLTYDDAEQLSSVKTPGTLPANCGQPLTSLYSFVPDPVSNLTSFTGRGGTAAATYNNVNQVSTFGSQTFGYDASGRETSDGTRSYKWDAEDRLIEISAGSTVLATFRYDGLGRRLEVSHPGRLADRFSWCGTELCARRLGDVTFARHFREGEYYPRGKLLAPIVDGSGAATFVPIAKKLVYTTNQLGNVTGFIDADRRVLIGGVEYTPYGEIKSGRLLADIPYAGLYRDGLVGLYYSATRVYDPSIGAWLSRDPIGENAGINLYAYAGRDPINRKDPSGLLDDPENVTELIRDTFMAGFALGSAFVALVGDAGLQDGVDFWAGPPNPDAGGQAGFYRPVPPDAVPDTAPSCAGNGASGGGGGRDKPKKKGYECEAKCQSNGAPTGAYYVFGYSSENCGKAMKDAKANIPLGEYPRHCSCSDSLGFRATGHYCENHTR
jgi:RHS repeat-associated protein